MSDEITTEMTTGETELSAVTVNDGVLMVDLSGLPAGSFVTLTVRIGPETPPAPETAPAAAPRFLGTGRINRP